MPCYALRGQGRGRAHMPAYVDGSQNFHARFYFLFFFAAGCFQACDFCRCYCKRYARRTQCYVG